MLFILLMSCFVFPVISFGDILTENEDRYTMLLHRVESLEMRDAKQQVEIDFLRAELVEEKKETKRLKEIIQERRQGLEDSEDTLTPAETEGPEIKDIKATNNKNGGPRIRQATPRQMFLHNLTENGGPRIRQATPEIVAFHAVLNNPILNVGLHQNIAFDKVITNIGGAYNQHFGSFVAPVSGVYVFFTTITGEIRDAVNVGILKNGVLVAQIHIRNVESRNQSGSGMAVLQLHKGDDVAIQSFTKNTGIDGHYYSMVSGFLLAPYE